MYKAWIAKLGGEKAKAANLLVADVLIKTAVDS
jgi:hypothetical protein